MRPNAAGPCSLVNIFKLELEFDWRPGASDPEQHRSWFCTEKLNDALGRELGGQHLATGTETRLKSAFKIKAQKTNRPQLAVASTRTGTDVDRSIGIPGGN
jgi:hypothetical protein